MSENQSTQPTPEIESIDPGIASRFDAIRAEVDDVLRRREELFVTTHAELIAAGIEAHIIDTHGDDWESGSRVMLVDEHYIRRYGTSFSRRSIQAQWKDYHQALDGRRGPYELDSGTVLIFHGAHEVLVSDGGKTLIATVEDDDAENGHKRAVNRLRNRAKAEHFRVRVHDHDIALISPMNDVVHEGDVNTAYLWLAGIDPDTAEVTA